MKKIKYEKPRTISVDDAVLAELRAENERLVIKANAEHIARQNAEAENDALRELLEDLWPRAAFTMRPGDRHDYGERMRGLGLEVD